jgi:hypothetical protein
VNARIALSAFLLAATAVSATAQDAPKPPEPPPPVPAPPKLFEGTPADLAAKFPNVSLRDIGRSRGGRPLVLVTVLGKDAKEGEVDWEALVVAGLSGNRDRGDTRLALDVAARLAETDGAIPPRCAVRVLADANPDTTAYAQGVRRRAGNDLAVDEDQDGDTDEDGPDDLDGDGHISWMRFPDPAGDQHAGKNDKGEATFEAADAAKGKQPTHRLVREGKDDDGDGVWNEDGPGGVDLARNFTWRFEEHVPLCGRWPASEPETRAILDLLLADEKIAIVYELGDADTIQGLPGWGGAWTQLPDPDVALLNGLREMHGAGPKVPREAKAPGAGSLGLAMIHHLGRLWFGRRPLGTLAPLGSASMVKTWRPLTAAGAPPGAELGDPEPPANAADYDLAAESAPIATFLTDLAKARARLEFRGVETSGAAGVLTIKAKLVDAGRLPTHTQRGADVRGRRPVNVRIRLPKDATLVAGKPLVQIERIAGGAESEPLVYVVRGPSGAKVTIEATGPDTGTVTTEAVIP